MTTEQLKKKDFKQVIKIKPHEELDTEEGESMKDAEESTTSTQLSEQDSISDAHTEDNEASKPTEAHQVHNVFNKDFILYYGCCIRQKAWLTNCPGTS